MEDWVDLVGWPIASMEPAANRTQASFQALLENVLVPDCLLRDRTIKLDSVMRHRSSCRRRIKSTVDYGLINHWATPPNNDPFYRKHNCSARRHCHPYAFWHKDLCHSAIKLHWTIVEHQQPANQRSPSWTCCTFRGLWGEALLGRNVPEKSICGCFDVDAWLRVAEISRSWMSSRWSLQGRLAGGFLWFVE